MTEFTYKLWFLHVLLVVILYTQARTDVAAHYALFIAVDVFLCFILSKWK